MKQRHIEQMNMNFRPLSNNLKSRKLDEIKTFKIGGNDREIKLKNYHQENDNLVLNPTRENINSRGRQEQDNNLNKRYMTRGKSQGFNIINNKTDVDFNPSTIVNNSNNNNNTINKVGIENVESYNYKNNLNHNIKNINNLNHFQKYDNNNNNNNVNFTDNHIREHEEYNKQYHQKNQYNNQYLNHNIQDLNGINNNINIDNKIVQNNNALNSANDINNYNNMQIKEGNIDQKEEIHNDYNYNAVNNEIDKNEEEEFRRYMASLSEQEREDLYRRMLNKYENHEMNEEVNNNKDQDGERDLIKNQQINTPVKYNYDNYQQRNVQNNDSKEVNNLILKLF